MGVQALYALQNGFMGFERSGLFYGELSGDRVQIPVTCYLIRTSDATILFDTGLSPRAIPGLRRTDPLARFTEEDLLVHRLDPPRPPPPPGGLAGLSTPPPATAGGCWTATPSSSPGPRRSGATGTRRGTSPSSWSCRRRAR